MSAEQGSKRASAGPMSRDPTTNMYFHRNWIALSWIIIICSSLVSGSYSHSGHHLTTSSTSTVVPDESGESRPRHNNIITSVYN